MWCNDVGCAKSRVSTVSKASSHNQKPDLYSWPVGSLVPNVLGLGMVQDKPHAETLFPSLVFMCGRLYGCQIGYNRRFCARQNRLGGRKALPSNGICDQSKIPCFQFGRVPDLRNVPLEQHSALFL